jgi:hypothetical protein
MSTRAIIGLLARGKVDLSNNVCRYGPTRNKDNKRLGAFNAYSFLLPVC